MALPAARLIVDFPRLPAANMAFDEALLDYACSLTVRATRWERPAATLGRFQPYQEFEIDGITRASIRRITGGGAILHGADCTLALVAETDSTSFPDPAPSALATRAADTLLEALVATLHAPLQIRGGEHEERDQVNIADCFARQSPFDLMISAGSRQAKAAGFALHRRASKVLVQASVVRSAVNLEPDQDCELLRRWAEALGAESSEASEFTLEETERARRYEKTRYGQDAWNRRV